jgi:hypothetical protein
MYICKCISRIVSEGNKTLKLVIDARIAKSYNWILIINMDACFLPLPSNPLTELRTHFALNIFQGETCSYERYSTCGSPYARPVYFLRILHVDAPGLQSVSRPRVSTLKLLVT